MSLSSHHSASPDCSLQFSSSGDLSSFVLPMVSFESNSRRHHHRTSSTTHSQKVPSEVLLPQQPQLQQQHQQVTKHTADAAASTLHSSRLPTTAATPTTTSNDSPSKRRRRSLDTMTPTAATTTTTTPSPFDHRAPRIRILPGSLWLAKQSGGRSRRQLEQQHGTVVAPPPPPSTPPPPPAMVLPAMMVGPNLCGKTSLLQSFVQRVHVATTTNHNQHQQPMVEQSDMSFRTTRTGKSSTVFTTTIPWNISYYKKDIAYQNASHGMMIRSLRWQFWDVSTAAAAQSMANHNNHSFTTNTTPATTTTILDPSSSSSVIQEPCSHLKRVFAASLAVIIAVSMYPFDIQNIVDQIRQWHSWIRSTLMSSDQDEEARTIFVCLTKADCCWNRHHNNNNHDYNNCYHGNTTIITPMDFMRLGGALTSLCQELSIETWFVTTAAANSQQHYNCCYADTIDAVFQTMAERIIARFEQDDDDCDKDNNKDNDDDDDDDNHSLEWGKFHNHHNYYYYYAAPSPISKKRS